MIACQNQLISIPLTFHDGSFLSILFNHPQWPLCLCVHTVWCSACLCQCDLVVSVSKKAALGEGVVTSTLHKAPLQRLPSKYTTEHYVKKQQLRTSLEKLDFKSKLANSTSYLCFYWLHSHQVNKMLMLRQQ